MLHANFNTYNNYVTDSLYQWDVNQDLVISGLGLSVAPEIHFANADMDRAIVRQSTLESGVVTVRIPNSLLQVALTIKAYVGIYEGDTFKVIETIEIPVIAKTKPADYTIEDSDEEIYSFKALENEIANAKKEIADRCEANRIELVATVEETTRTLNARVDNIIAHNNDTEGNTELIDIRTGVDGTVYNSAGEAVRAQFEELNDTITPFDDLTIIKFVNLINPNKLIKGYYVDNTNGNLASSSSYCVTDYIPVVGGGAYSLNSSVRYAWYNRNKEYITGGNNIFIGNAPNNAFYIRISVPTSWVNTIMFTPTKTTPAKYIPFSVEIPELNRKFSIKDLLIEGAKPTINLFNYATTDDGKYVNEANGELDTSAVYFASAFIECKGETTYAVNSYQTRFIAYDSDFCYVSGQKVSNSTKVVTYTTPTNAKYLKISQEISTKNDLMLVEGVSIPSAYIAYGITAPWLYTKTEISKYHGKKMVCFGDSITASDYTGTITEDTGIEAINVGMHSARYAYADDESVEKNAFALHNIIDSVCSGDWTIPDTIRGVSGYELQVSKIDLLKTMDFNNIDFVSFAYGTNDYASATPLTNTENLYDKNTVSGALRYAIKTLLTKYPHLRIIVSLPIYRFFTSDGVITSDGDTKNYGGGTLKEYCEAIKTAVIAEHIPYVDLYNNGGINAYNRLNYFNITDGTHPTKKGLSVIGHQIASGVLSYL